MKALGILPICFLMIIPFSFLNGQQDLIPKYEIGVQGGAFIYQGDLTPNSFGSFITTKPGFGINGSVNINRQYAIRLNLVRAWLKGDDAKYDYPAWRQQRNFNFKTPVTELTVSFIWNFLGLKSNEAGIINFSPYLIAGLGYSFLNIKRDWSQFNYSHFAPETGIISGLAEDINHQLPKGIFVMPVGAGVRYGINEKFSFTIESLYRLTTTDYLDGFSQAANPDKNDHYHSITIGLIYSFGKRNRFDCPVIRY